MPTIRTNSLGFGRDIVKLLKYTSAYLWTRLFYLDREYPSSVSVSASLDMIPRGSSHGRHRLVLKKRANIERYTVINTWHGDVILSEEAGIGVGSIVIGPVSFGKRSVCSQNCFLSGESHQYKNPTMNWRDQGFDIRPVVVEDDVWIGSNCIILPGVRIGEHSVVGAGSVVTKSVPPFCLVVGNPARVVRRYDRKSGAWVSESSSTDSGTR